MNTPYVKHKNGFVFHISYFVTFSYIFFHCSYKRNMKIDKIIKNETGNMKKILESLMSSFAVSRGLVIC